VSNIIVIVFVECSIVAMGNPTSDEPTVVATPNSDTPSTTSNTCEPNSAAPPPRFYPIGTPGQPWTPSDCDEWKARTSLQRSYRHEVLDRLHRDSIDESLFDIVRYGQLSCDPDRYPLYAVQTKDWTSSVDKPRLLVTGGVHGYETSGVQGAIRFLQTEAKNYADRFRMSVMPCVSPWAYEHVQRWNAEAMDPNRSFRWGGPTEEAEAVTKYWKAAEEKTTASESHRFSSRIIHVDLHETTDTDATEFMPAKHAKAGLPYEAETIPDGFYLVGDSLDPPLDFLSAVIEAVKEVTHIAPPDEKGTIIDEPAVREGVILVPTKELGLCCSVTGGRYVATTEVYPDSEGMTREDCDLAQVKAVVGALEFVIAKMDVEKKEKHG